MTVKLDKESEELLGTHTADNPPVVDGFRVPATTGRELAIAGDAYEGASRFSTELGSYQPATRSADQDIAPAKRLADARSRDLTRNDAYIRGGVTLRKDNIVGSYFMLNAQPNSFQLFGKEDAKWEEEFQEEVEEKFAAYVESPRNWLDASGHSTLTQMVRMAIEQHTVHGEVLASVEWLRAGRRPFHTAIQMIDVDRLSTPPEQSGNPNIVMGVELGPVWHEPVAYHFRKAHPSDWSTPNSFQWRRQPKELPWGRLQMIHLFEQFRPAQTRGIGTMITAIPEMKMSRQFRDVVLQNAIVNATYAATIESDSFDASTIFAQLGGTDFPPEKVMEAMMAMSKGYYEMVASTVGKSKNLQIGGVKIPWLPPGSKLNLQGAGQGGPLGTDFESSLHRAMATAFGVSYEQWSKDYSKTNYSSYKGAMTETYKAMASIKKAVADTFASWVYRLWLEEALNQGQITSIRRNMPSWYEGQNEEWYSDCDWVGASRGQVDEVKETEAAILRIDNGLSDLKTENARLGRDWRKGLRQMKREMEWKEFYGVMQEEKMKEAASTTAAKKDAKK
ncbi:phage portal protein [Aquamicrobium zhengzhouense]|uniref:Phage portal protein n=1 Tax=Aquamicrobium zhengzhouense TaxID=2781738 RepID=A0ABS0S9P9_9HYPH|nr:phage portal protein [Aquamicrobium zhengzhouense]MBI1620009.1 phage portal protein [Aquamicrobium zhengzhouense]